MKKIIAVLLMMCMAFSVSVDAKGKKTTRKAVKKTERAMTAFEKSQKEEYLNYLLIRCEYWYNKGDIEAAEKLKKEYEKTKSKNYYVRFRNVEFGSKEEKEQYGKMGVDTLAQTVFIKCGFIVNVHFSSNGECVLHMNNNDISSQLEIIYDTNYGLLNNITPNEIFEELIDEINEASGYNARSKKKCEEIEVFLNQQH